VTVKQIRESELLEYYVLGLLDKQEASRVEGYLLQYPELQEDYLAIQKSLQSYATAKSVTPRAQMRDNIKDLINSEGSKEPITNVTGSRQEPSTTKTASSGRLTKVIGVMLAIAAGALLSALLNERDEVDSLQQQVDAIQAQCDSTTTAQQQELDSYRLIQDKDSRTISLTPTEGYQEATLILHTNELIGRNFLQIKNLPAIGNDQAFQLWSLKEGQDPIPLTVFKDGSAIIPVSFEAGTGTYAITIERAEGATTPDLTKLIGTLSV